MIKRYIKRFARLHGYAGVEKTNIQYKCNDVYRPHYNGRGPVYVGYPLFVLVQYDECRLSTPEESIEILDLLNPPQIEKCYICKTPFDINTDVCPYCGWWYLGYEDKLNKNEREPCNTVSISVAKENYKKGLTIFGNPLPQKRIVERVRYIKSKKEDFLIENNHIDLEPNKIYTVVERVKNRWIRVVDESGEDYCYPIDFFEKADEYYEIIENSQKENSCEGKNGVFEKELRESIKRDINVTDEYIDEYCKFNNFTVLQYREWLDRALIARGRKSPDKNETEDGE